MEIVQQNFRPEFINRIDDIVVFQPLGAEQIRAIVDIQLGYLRKRLLERDIELTLDDKARDLLGEAGFDPVYGARPLKRAIQQQIENPLAQHILRGEFGPGRPGADRRPGGRSLRSRRTEAAIIPRLCRSTNTNARTASSTPSCCRRSRTRR